MPKCYKRGKHFRKGLEDGEICEACDEHRRDLEREERGVVCQHCGQVFMPSGFEQHRWQIYYRLGERPKGRKLRL